VKILTKILSLLLLLQYNCVIAQFYGSIDKLEDNNQLCNGKINCFAQDQEQAIWIGTEYGLARYNGHNFTNYYYAAKDSNSLSHNTIYDLLVDKDGTVFKVSRRRIKSVHQYLNCNS
jgi:ligand-binding sensor domain-containing protein